MGSKTPKSSEFKEALGQAIIDKIEKRTGQKKDRTGKSFKSPYSKQYRDSLKFKAAGKSRSNVNLKLTGDMLGLMDIIETTKDKIIIGWDDSKQSAKAHGHVTGSKRGPKVKRDFLGLPAKELRDIIDKVKDEFNGED